MNYNPFASQIAVLSLVLVSICSCGGGSSKAGKAAEVRQMSTDASSVMVGDDVDLVVEFSFSTDTVVHDNHNVSLKVRVPYGLRFQSETARIDEIGGTDKVTPIVESCASGETYLHFDLGQSVLANAADASRGADGKLILALKGVEAVGPVLIDALAGYDFENVSASCAMGMEAQDTTLLVVR